MNELLSLREKMKKQIRDIDIYSYKEIISALTPEQRDELFLIDGFDILKSGYNNLIHKMPNMDTLVSIGVITGLIYSIYNINSKI